MKPKQLEALRKRLRPDISKPRITEEQLSALLERAAAGVPTADICAEFGLSQQTVTHHIRKACRENGG
jgi:DNA-binding NarL/FixJ family response regulator